MIYLAGADGEGPGLPDDPLIVAYEAEYCLENCFFSRLRFSLNATSYVVETVNIQFLRPETNRPSPVSTSEVHAAFGPSYRVVRHRLVDLEGELEAELSKCDDPTGTIRTWLYQAQGLQVFLSENAELVSSLRFSPSILEGEESFPPCQPK